MCAKKIDFTDFVKKFFGNSDNPYQNFINSTVVPFRNLVQEAFGYQDNTEQQDDEQLEQPQQVEEMQEQVQQQTFTESENEGDLERFDYAQKIAVQILSQLEYGRNDYSNQMAMQACRAIVKTANQKDEDIMCSLAFALKSCKAKQVKFLVKELCDLFI